MENCNLAVSSITIGLKTMTSIFHNITGLKPEHAKIHPLFEKIYFPPDYGGKEISRLYPDGSLYFFIEKEDERNGENDGEWGFISTVNNKGMAEINSRLEIVSDLKSDDTKGGNVKGIVLWKVFAGKKAVEITTTIQPVSKLKVFEEIEMIINSNLNSIAAG
jgi:hypothetical protein